MTIYSVIVFFIDNGEEYNCLVTCIVGVRERVREREREREVHAPHFFERHVLFSIPL